MMDFNLIALEHTVSTNAYLSALLSQHPAEFTVVSAEYQSAGKGQRGNSWESGKGANLLFSQLFYPDFLAVSHQFLLSKTVALAIKEELDEYASGFSIKWPNDIYWNDLKICGFLTENELLGSTILSSIVGIGLNVNQEVFRSDAPNPVSLRQITGRNYVLTNVLHSLAQRIIRYYHLLREGSSEEIERRYHLSLYRNEGFYLYRDVHGEFSAQIMEVRPEGTLVLQDQSGSSRSYLFKEVEVVR